MCSKSLKTNNTSEQVNKTTSKRSSSVNEGADLVQAQTRLQDYVAAASSDNTRRAYRSAIRQFEKWGGRLPTNSHSLIRYMLDKAELLNPRTLDLHLTALSQWHHYQGFTDPARDPLVRKTMEGIRRKHAKPKQKSKALRLEHVAQMLSYLDSLPEGAKKYRDKALVLCGFLGAFRRSELVAIQVQDLRWEPEGLIVNLPRSKTDQSAQGLARALPFGKPNCCAALAVQQWLEFSGLKEGPLFRPINRWGHVQQKPLNPAAVNGLLKNIGEACGFEFTAELSSHSLRRGMSTSAAREGVAFELIKKQGGWKSDATVWEYIEEGQQFTENASGVLMSKLDAVLKGQD